jgi:ABC-type branched-subunit amino acid transport system substrate-binding protein
VSRVVIVLLAFVAAIATGCGGDEGAAPVETSACGKLLYEGKGEPDVIVVADNTLRGDAAATSKEIVDAIEHVLRQREFRAGELRVGFQSCDDAVGDGPDAGQCRRNARAFVETDAVVGIIGPLLSGCAELQIPIVSRTDAGPLAMISPTTTFLGLTRGPDSVSLYPDGARSYARVVTHDQAQAIAAAHLAKRFGARRAAVLVQRGLDDEYALALTPSFRAAARALGIDAKSFEWPHRERYTELAASVAAARPDVVYLVGLPEGNADTLIEDLRAEVGQIPIITPDSFAAADMAEELGPIGEGLLTTVPGVPADALPPAGKRFLRDFGTTLVAPGPGPAEAAQATEVLLDAIARSDGARESVVQELFATKVENGILGSFTFDRFGDIDPAPVGVYRYEGGKIVTEGVVRAPLSSG